MILLRLYLSIAKKSVSGNTFFPQSLWKNTVNQLNIFLRQAPLMVIVKLHNTTAP
ncbi:hypothetical protein NIES22_38080 [Calothrix brevissima NIES-22]|nr:hypothetical protein NIES22_38080 [Calothrix brevissima NIES-22]